jgi:hypothetical protein
MNKYFDEWRAILRPWLGEVRPFNLPSDTEDMVVLVDGITGLGFTQLVFRNRYANPDWILPRWRQMTGMICPACKAEIAVLARSHRTGPQRVTGGPFVFCNCVRIEPSRLPSVDFFTLHWPRVLEAVSFLKATAREVHGVDVTIPAHRGARISH